ncbi:hypothetical protein ACFS6H_12320 [Terrimonas rubra]|uniref:DUF4129 domain-containing protein n=1 Tax=Terrimonas rubra TaxID=1035890 RepID=A0ABW6A6W0_9BACT
MVCLLLLIGCTISFAQTTDTTKTDVRISEVITEDEIIVKPVQNQDEEDEDDKYSSINGYFHPVYFNDSTGEKLTQRQIQAGVKDSFLRQNDFWYVNHKEEAKKSSGGDTYLGSISWLGPFLWVIIIGGFLIFIAWWYINNGQGSLFRRDPRAFGNESEAEDIPEDIFAINYAAAISKAMAAGDYRLAVRLMYLQVLANMHHRNIIKYKQDATNFDYLMQLHQTGYYPEFFKVTRHYEYAWYGLFPVNKQAFDAIKQDIDALNQKISYR